MRLLHAPLAASAALALAPFASAQFGDAWVEFQPDPSRIVGATISSPFQETDLAWGDLNQDGLTDLVVARVEPIIAEGKRTNLLMMNEGGVLTNRTSEFASASDVPGDQGFLTPTADRDVQVVDVNGDDWLDVVMCVGFGQTGEAKAISHPRVYINLGEDGGGNWLGLEYQEARIPQLINFNTGNPVRARFNAVAAGDVDGDDDIDLYFGDHDASSANPFGGESANLDTDDRLFLNDGNGFFTDATMSALNPAIINSAFSNAALIADVNGDGENEIIKQTNGPARVETAYEDSVTPGTFSSLQTVYTGSPYFFSGGDLNNDGRLDLIISENGNDGVVYNTATAPNGEVIWSPLQTFDFLSGGDDSFASNSLAADLNGDGLQDVLISDVDPQIAGFNRRLHIYHNRGVQPSMAALLREERETAGAGWIGFVGATTSDLQGTHDIAFFDVDGDNLGDLIISRNADTLVWLRQPVCQADLGLGVPGFDLEV
ncbi:MAG: FG-GAP-like repeat-containing protein, partial [Planctomycetota bacterium]